MSHLVIDFARPSRPYPALVRIGMLALGAGLLAWLVLTAKQVQAEIATRNTQLQNQQQHAAPMPASAQLTEALAAAERTQQGLHTPWLQTLANLEQVSATHPEIKLLSVSPNRDKAEVRIVAEAKQFEAITAFLQALKQQPQFADAVLQNQHLQETDNASTPIYNFSAALSWRMLAAQNSEVRP